MTLVEQLLAVTDAFGRARSLRPSRVSVLLFNDGKRLPAIRAGGDLRTAGFERAMAWLSANWPEGAEWPPEVPRPETLATLAPDAPGENGNQPFDFTADEVMG